MYRMGLLPRIFPAFPSGFPGVALLLVRVVIGVALAAHGAISLETSDPPLAIEFSGLVEIACGAMLSIGFLTPFAGVVAAVQAISVRLHLLSGGPSPLYDCPTAFSFGLAILLMVIVQGPGAYSVDARRFGRREIIIPRAKPRPEPDG